jgi:hypothetical protein
MLLHYCHGFGQKIYKTYKTSLPAWLTFKRPPEAPQALAAGCALIRPHVFSAVVL